MTKTELKQAVYSAVYRIVSNATPPSLNEFLDTKVDDSIPDTNGPNGWPDFWWESIYVEIQGAVMVRKVHIINFNYEFIKTNKAKKWSDLIDLISTKIVPL